MKKKIYNPRESDYTFIYVKSSLVLHLTGKGKMAKKIYYLGKLAGALIKHKLGESAYSLVLENVSEYVGEDISEKIDEFISNNKLEDALKQADEIFSEVCNDDNLKQAIHELPMFGSPELSKIAKQFAKDLDYSKLKNTFKASFKRYWGSKLSDEQISNASYIYQISLERALAVYANQTLPALIGKTERIEINTNEILARQSALEDAIRQDLPHIIAEKVFSKIAANEKTQSSMISKGELDINLEGLTKDEIQFNSQLDQCKLLLTTGNPIAAEKLLNNIELSLKDQTISYKIRWRLKTLQGSSAIALQDDTKGASLFEEAYLLNPNDSKAIANLALARIIEKKYSEAVDLATKAIEINPSETAAYATRVFGLANDKQNQAIPSLVNEDYFNNPDYLRALGIVNIEAGEYTKAIEYLRLSLAIESSNSYTKLSLVSALIKAETSQLQESSGYLIRDDFNPESLTTGAMALVKEIIADAKNGDNPHIELDAMGLVVCLKSNST